jgi:hypothetical protein
MSQIKISKSYFSEKTKIREAYKSNMSKEENKFRNFDILNGSANSYNDNNSLRKNSNFKSINSNREQPHSRDSLNYFDQNQNLDKTDLYFNNNNNNSIRRPSPIPMNKKIANSLNNLSVNEEDHLNPIYSNRNSTKDSLPLISRSLNKSVTNASDNNSIRSNNNKDEFLKNSLKTKTDEKSVKSRNNKTKNSSQNYSEPFLASFLPSIVPNINRANVPIPYIDFNQYSPRVGEVVFPYIVPTNLGPFVPAPYQRYESKNTNSNNNNENNIKSNNKTIKTSFNPVYNPYGSMQVPPGILAYNIAWMQPVMLDESSSDEEIQDERVESKNVRPAKVVQINHPTKKFYKNPKFIFKEKKDQSPENRNKVKI